MRKWRVTGSKFGKVYTVVIEAPDHNGAVLKATKGRGMCLVVSSCVLIDEGGAA